MRISVMVCGGPFSTQASYSALRFCRAVLDEGHELAPVFFYQDGVYNGTRLSVPPQDETDLVGEWAELRERGARLVVCVAAAQRRGVLDQAEARREGCDADNLHPAFELGGVGLLTEAVIETDRFVQFGD